MHDAAGRLDRPASWFGFLVRPRLLRTAHRKRHGRVTNLENGRRVVVVIDDRGPFIRGRVIDLSVAAAQRLGMVRDGVVLVRIKVVRWAEGSEV